MTEPWFNPNAYAWIPGTVLGVAAGTWGALAGVCAPRGKCRTLIMGTLYADLLISCLLLAAGVVALATGQPWGVWYGLGYPGLLDLILVVPSVRLLRRLYREAELNKSRAEDL